MTIKVILIVPVLIVVRFIIHLILAILMLKFIKRQQQRSGINIEVAKVPLKLSQIVNGIIAVIGVEHRREVPGHVSRADLRREKANIDTGLKPTLIGRKVVIFVICARLMVARGSRRFQLVKRTLRQGEIYPILIVFKRVKVVADHFAIRTRVVQQRSDLLHV